MKFKRRRFRKFSRSRRSPSTATLQRTKAKKRFNWVTLLDSTCDVAFLPPRSCEAEVELGQVRPFDLDCGTGAPTGFLPASAVRLSLVEPASTLNDDAQAVYAPDEVAIVRMVGSINLFPYYIMRAPFLAIFDAAPEHTREALLTLARKDRSYFARAGLKKDEAFWDETNQVWGFHERDPFNTEDWTDGQYQRIWTFEKFPGQLGGHTAQFMSAGNQIGACADVHTQVAGAPAPNVFDDGDGVFDIATDCDVVELGTTNATSGVWTAPEQPLRISLSSRRRMTFKENEGLNIWLNYTTVDYERVTDPFCNFSFHDLAVGLVVRAHVKALVET